MTSGSPIQVSADFQADESVLQREFPYPYCYGLVEVRGGEGRGGSLKYSISPDSTARPC